MPSGRDATLLSGSPRGVLPTPPGLVSTRPIFFHLAVEPSIPNVPRDEIPKGAVPLSPQQMINKRAFHKPSNPRR